jgi:RNA polymerase sigma factor (sigma-70 family)
VADRVSRAVSRGAGPDRSSDVAGGRDERRNGSRGSGRRPPPFGRFLDEHRREVYRLLRALVGPHDAEDCFQETFLAALRAYPRLRDGEDLRAWVLTIATRKAIDHARAARRRPAPLERPPERAAPEPEAADPELWRMVGALPPKQRAAIVHRYVLDLPYAEIALALGCSEAAARASAAEGRRRLREMLTGPDEGGRG